MDNSVRQLIFQAIDESISPENFEHLQTAIEQDEEVRTEYLQAVRLCQSMDEIASSLSDDALESTSEPPSPVVEPAAFWNRRALSLASAAVAVLCLVSWTGFWFGQQRVVEAKGTVDVRDQEVRMAGHAALRRSVDLQWRSNATVYREGDVLPDGRFQFDGGVAEIDFFCGATLIVEGPATLDVESDWSVRVIEGRLRANVPPAARGFVIKAADSEIIDLGTEFALEVGPDMARVDVLDGEIKLRGGAFDGDHLRTGDSQLLKGSQSRPEVFKGLSTVSDVQRLRENAEGQRFAAWQADSRTLAADSRLIAYYPIAQGLAGRVIKNAGSLDRTRDAQLVGPVNPDVGRFGAASTGLEFDRPGARVRARIDGEFSALTFACWVRIDSLEHVYNALFMSDGYENGELHWQIRNDGRLMFSVMVDDSRKTRHFSKIDQTFVESAGLAKIYFTDSIWDVSKSGQWFHLVAVYDPASRQVEQFVDGERLSTEKIPDRYFVDSLRIGPAEIGNWGQPFRNTPWFAVRNLNGTIDELAIFSQPLTAEEIRNIYEQGKPLGY